jgi:thymidylate synthase ThyX
MYDRSLSRNASSSRAVPVPRLIEDIRRDLAEPLFWGKNQAGMQAAEELDDAAKRLAQDIWRSNREACIRDALDLHALGAHKQLVNRLVEKHGYINVVVTGTNWSNFFALRRHEGAQPEIRYLADLIREAQQASTPNVLKLG